MNVTTEEETIEKIFLPWRSSLGEFFNAYKGHVYRVFNFTMALLPEDDAELEEYGSREDAARLVAIAGCFHDVGIWFDGSMDYLAPSQAHARKHMDERGLAKHADAVDAMIEYHHKLTPYRGEHSVLLEAFRRADLVDVSLGMIRNGVPRSFVSEVRRAIPNAGFHWILTKGLAAWALRHPLNPLPMMRR